MSLNGRVTRSTFTATLTHPSGLHACWNIFQIYSLALQVDTFPYYDVKIANVLSTGVITYSTNLNTCAVVRHMSAPRPAALRILLETDAPFMIPSNLYNTLKNLKGKLPLSHSAMIPWTAEFVAMLASEAAGDAGRWDAERVLWEARENAKKMYNV